MILILAGDADRAVSQVERLLLQRGAPYLRFNHARFPAQARVWIDYGEDVPPSGEIETNGARYGLAAFSAVWDRRPDPPMVAPEITRGMTQRFVMENCGPFIEDLWHMLECRWLPAPAATVRRVEDKVVQMKAAHALGFDLPPALITNDPDEFLEFYREHNGRIVSQGFHRKLLPPETPDERQAFRVFTEAVANRAAGYARSIRYSPVLFQAHVPKRCELRVIVAGRRVFAVEILSQAAHHTRHDRTPRRPRRLPAETERLCIALVERLGLSFGAIDLVLTPDGRYVFIEIDPNGEWQSMEELTELPIAQAICEYLAGGTDLPGPPVGTLAPECPPTDPWSEPC